MSKIPNVALLVTWPIHVDYPLFRAQTVRDKNVYSQRIASFSNHHEKLDLQDFLNAHLQSDGFDTVPAREIKGDMDWRTHAIINGFSVMRNAEYILFTEQDFFITKKCIDTIISSQIEQYDCVVYQEGERLHPAFFCIKRELFDYISLDFAPVKDMHDHFYIIAKQVQSYNWTSLHKLGFSEQQDFYHMRGLTDNYARLNKSLPLVREDEFIIYNQFCSRLAEQNSPFIYNYYSAVQRTNGRDYSEHWFYKFLDTLWLSFAINPNVKENLQP